MLTLGMIALLQDSFHSDVGAGVSLLLSCLAIRYSLARHDSTYSKQKTLHTNIYAHTKYAYYKKT